VVVVVDVLVVEVLVVVGDAVEVVVGNNVVVIDVVDGTVLVVGGCGDVTEPVSGRGSVVSRPSD